ncbi:MerR family transcriptional regulator, partial [Proteus mirabilis]
QDTGGNPDFFVRLNKMNISDDKFATDTGITKQMIDFVAQGFSEYQLSVFKPHLTPEPFAVVHQHYVDAGSVWPELL